MAEQDSIEFKTVKACSVALGKTLKGADSGMVSFLEENGFITDEVRLRVIDVKTPLSAADKTNLLVEGIKDRIDLDEDSYKVLVDKFKLSGVIYGPIVKKLDKEYEKQYAAANPNTTPAATTSDGSGGGGATGNPSASQPNTATSAKIIKTRTVLEGHHFRILTNQLHPYAAHWEKIAEGLNFKGNEIANIRADPSRIMGGPGSYLSAVLTTWMNWGPPDERGTEDVATLELLQQSVNRANLGKLVLTLKD